MRKYIREKMPKKSGVPKKLKYRQAGHVIRDSKLKWNNILTTWVLHTGEIARGPPRTRWSDELERVFIKGWMREAKVGMNWKGLVSAHAQKQAASSEQHPITTRKGDHMVTRVTRLNVIILRFLSTSGRQIVITVPWEKGR